MTCLYLFNRTIVNPEDIFFAEPAMLYKEYGSTGKRISVIGCGGMRLPTPHDHAAGIAILHAARRAGINYFDTAPFYCDDQSEAEVGIGFMFAPNHHPAMKNVAPVRKELGIKTIFNILGPLTNPAGAPNILMGVFHPDLVGIQVRALQRLGAEHAVVVYGRDGMDEVSLGAATLVGELRNGEIREYEIHPEDFGMPMASNRALRVETPEQSRTMLLGVLDNEAGAARDIVILNAGAALYAANVADSMVAGVALARKAIESGAARQKLDQLIAVTRQLAA